MNKLKSAIIDGIRKFTERQVNDRTMADFIEEEVGKTIDHFFYLELSEVNKRLAKIESSQDSLMEFIHSSEEYNEDELN